MPKYKANLRMVINFDAEVEADTPEDAMLCLSMEDNPSADRTLADVIMAFGMEPGDVKAQGIIVRYFKEVREF